MMDERLNIGITTRDGNVPYYYQRLDRQGFPEEYQRYADFVGIYESTQTFSDRA